jgi:hypothetical protein
MPNMFRESKNYCIGIIKGILKYNLESKSEFKNWAVDAPEEYINIIMDRWKKNNPNLIDICEVERIVEEIRKIK